MSNHGKNTSVKNGGGNMYSSVKNRSKSKRKKAIIISIVAAVLLIAIIITVVIVLQNKSPELTRITTYNVEAVTYGNVSTTVSGSGSLTPVTKSTLAVFSLVDEQDTEDAPLEQTEALTVSQVNFTAGDEVDKGEVIAVLKRADESTVNLVAPYDAVVLESYIATGDALNLQSNTAMLMGKDGFTLSVAVDELNISSVELGQTAEISIDAVSGDYSGTVTDISYNGQQSGNVTYYQIEVTVDYVENVYPGMSVSAEIVIEDSGDGLLVPVDAVHTSGDISYVYLAPDGSALGDEYEEDDIDTSKLKKAVVETGMSDGTYMQVKSNQLSEGALIIVAEITSTLTGSDEGGSGNGGGFGGGGGMGGFGGGNFDFGNFDPSQFGGSFPGRS